tara:strand:+ start:256 stop:402 length:147 start_codon:yes stop_codon:yes gene_type:complete
LTYFDATSIILGYVAGKDFYLDERTGKSSQVGEAIGKRNGQTLFLQYL